MLIFALATGAEIFLSLFGRIVKDQEALSKLTDLYENSFVQTIILQTSRG